MAKRKVVNPGGTFLGKQKTTKKINKATIQLGKEQQEVQLKPKHFENSGRDGFHGFRMVALNGKVYRCQIMLFEQ